MLDRNLWKSWRNFTYSVSGGVNTYVEKKLQEIFAGDRMKAQCTLSLVCKLTKIALQPVTTTS